jgi:alpha-1,3-rhamnosyl/mannosyltransferase
MSTYVANLLKEIPELDPVFAAWPTNNFLWTNVRVPLHILRRRWRLFHAPNYTAPLLKVAPLVLTVHDVSYLVRADWYPYKRGPVRQWFYRASIRVADRVVVPSRFSLNELLRFFPEIQGRVRAVKLAVSSEFWPDSTGASEVRRTLGLPNRFLLHVGDIHKRRNVSLVVEAGRKLELPVVVVGRCLDPECVLQSDVLQLTGVTVEQLRGIYSAATAFLYLSVYEGFGLPLLEAMACGCPVVASDRASIPEVCGQAAALVEPRLEVVVPAVKRVLADRTEFVRRGFEQAGRFSWKETARQTRDVYQELLG